MHALLLISLSILAAQTKMLAPLKTAKDRSKIIPGRYIVKLRAPASSESGAQQSTLAAMTMHADWLSDQMPSHPDSRVHHMYELAQMAGYSGDFSDPLIQAIRERPEVEYIEHDQVVHLSDEQFLYVSPQEVFDWRDFLGLDGRPPRRATRAKRPGNVPREQGDAPWGLKRLSNRRLPAAGGLFTYPESAGEKVDVYVIDTGINTRHKDFGGRAVWGKTVPRFDLDLDGNGHGTHCAGTIAGRRYGVAKRAKLFAVKVLMTSGFGTNSDVIKGVEWVIKRHFKRSRLGRRSVANMSLGGGKSLMLEEIVNLAGYLGVHFAVAAGNDNDDACESSPAGAPGPLTVGASDSHDSMAWFSNYGPCVDIFAPGVNITSAWIGSRFASNTISGTSMAAPHVCGVLALYLGEKDYKPDELKKLIIRHARKNVIQHIPDQSGTVNRLACIDALLHDPSS